MSDTKTTADINGTEVPKILHFLWLGKFGRIQQNYIDIWVDMNPGHHIRIWYDPHALLSHELGKRITASVLSQEKYLVYTSGYIDSILQLQNRAHDHITRAMSQQGQTFDDAAEDFMRKELHVSGEELQRIRQQNADSYQEFMQQHKNNPRITLADVNTLIGTNIRQEHYYRELSLRQNLPAASDMVRLEALYKEGGGYFDADLLPRLKESVFAGINYPDLSGDNRRLIDFARTQLILEYLQQSSGYFNARQAQVDAGQYKNFVQEYIDSDTDTAGVAGRRALIRQLRHAIQQAGQAHTGTSLLAAFFSPLEPARSHADIGRMAFVTGSNSGINNSVIIAHSGSQALRRAFDRVNMHYAVLAEHGLMQQVFSMDGLLQQIEQTIRTQGDKIDDYGRILGYRADGLTDARVTVYLTGPTMLIDIFRACLEEKIPDPDDDRKQELPEELLFHDYNVATEEDAKSSWVNNDNRRWPFRELVLTAGIEERLREAGVTPQPSEDKALQAIREAEDKALRAVADLFKKFQTIQDTEKKINTLVALKKQVDVACKLRYRGTSVSDELYNIQNQINGGMFLDVMDDSMAALVAARGTKAEAKKSLSMVLECMNALYTAPDTQKVVALFSLRRQLVNTLTLLPSASNEIFKTLSIMRAAIDRYLFSEDRKHPNIPMPASIREKILRISFWSAERAAVIHYHADAALYGAAGYSSEKAHILADQETGARMVLLEGFREQISRLVVLAGRISNGNAGLNTEEEQLVSRFLDTEEITVLSGKSTKSKVLRKAVQAMAEKYAADSAESLVMNEREAFRAVLEKTIRVMIESSFIGNQVVDFMKRALSAAAFKTLHGALGGRVDPDKEQWAWTPEKEEQLRNRIQEKLMNLDFHQDIAESRWVVQLRGDGITSDAAISLFLKHFLNSELILWNPHAPISSRNISLRWNGQHLVEGPVAVPEKNLKILLVGHGPDGSDDIVFAGRSSQMWQEEFRQMLGSIPRGVEQIHITLAGCRLVDGSLPGQLAAMLLARGRELNIAPENLSLSAHKNYIRVGEDGRKETYLNGRWVSTASDIARSEGYKSTWHYDRYTGSMLPDSLPVRFHELTDSLWKGHIRFDKLSITDRQLVSDILERWQIDDLLMRTRDGRVVNEAVKIMAAKFAGTPEEMTIGKETLGIVLDEDLVILEELALKAGIDARDTEANRKAGRVIVNAIEQQGSGVGITGGRHTLNALGLRARVLYGLQMAGNGVLLLGTAAALCRLYTIRKRLLGRTLGEEDRAVLRVEERLVIAELCVDLTQELSEFISSKFGIRLSRLPVGSDSVSVSSSLRLGARMTQGLRLTGLSTASTVLTAVGTGFAWYGVITAAKELQKLVRSTDGDRQSKIGQLQVNLGVNIVTALVSTVLTVGAAVSLVSGIAAALGITGAAGVATTVAAFMSVVSPVGGAILVAAFVGLWVYNGTRTVEEFSRHMTLSGWDKFALGFGSIFGYVLPDLQIRYEAERLKAAVEKAAELEKSGLLENLPEVRALYQFRAVVIPGREIEYRREATGWFDGVSWPITEVIGRESIPAQTDIRVIDINAYEGWYLSESQVDSSDRKQLKPEDFLHVRQGREVVWSDKGYHHGAFLTLQGRQVELPNSAFGPDNQNLDSVAVSAKLTAVLPQELKSILAAQPQSWLYAADEARHLALFCIHDGDRKISSWKFQPPGHPPGAGDRYALEFSYTQGLPAGLDLKTAAAVLFHDLDGNGLADLVGVSREGDLRVLLQQRNGNFTLREDFSLYRMNDEENLSFPWYDYIEGFGGTARTLYSRTSGGVRYAHVILSETEKRAMVSLVNLNRGA